MTKSVGVDKQTKSGNRSSVSLEAEENGVIEELAVLAHQMWSGWMRHQFKVIGETQSLASSAGWWKRWEQQMNTPYAELSEQEKESDRVEARRMLAICTRAASSVQDTSQDNSEDDLGERTSDHSQIVIPKDSSESADQRRVQELEAWLTRIITFYRHASGLPLNLQAYCMRSEAHVALGHARLTSWAVELGDILTNTTPEFAASCLASLGRIASLQPENDSKTTDVESHGQASSPVDVDSIRKSFNAEYGDLVGYRARFGAALMDMGILLNSYYSQATTIKALQDENERLRSSPQQQEWMPMNSAPKDRRILLWCVHANAAHSKDPIAEGWEAAVIGEWTEHNGRGWTWHGMTGKFTGWQPLPPPPMQGEK